MTSSNPISPPPFSGCLKKKGDKQKSQKFLDVFKQLHIKILLVDALEQMPSYVKFLKDILAKKRRMTDFEIVALMQTTSDVFKNEVLEKMTDAGTHDEKCFKERNY